VSRLVPTSSRGTKEGRIEMAWELGEAALSVGLVVAGSYFTGGLSLALLSGSALLSGHSALSQTNELIKTNTATNTALDPTAGLLPPEMNQHWGRQQPPGSV
jgi:hypothetical protein